MNGMKYTYIECTCSDFAHLFRVVYDPEETDMDNRAWMEVQLNQWRPWYKRVWIGIRYMFGAQSRFGAYDTTSLEREQAEKFIAILREAYPL